ncbi:hypothetical protein OHS33_33420 [Streptomyces sp. NBC_00536]|uniref:hypothetical protein n=1 Tax=Streptomyces sp. NBC_00536 TaxID=2975769 RepID=UPI002E80EB61|nr:hypothetical protein [Streptomyces sp. NBC_00536]WUC82834.1 hypothetical protein OHS33_33420 [Streptomyces sp. NBC_00536]
MVNATTEHGHAEGTEAFLRHMIWRYPHQRQPVMALLGPRRSGKSTLLASLSQGCGSTVVHAHLDFHENPVDPVSAAALVAFQMMRGWDTLRHSPVFHRFALGLLALNETLETDRTQATDQIRGLIQAYTRGTRHGRFATRLEGAAVTTMDVVATGALSPLVSGAGRQVVAAVRDQARPVIGSLLQSAARWGLRDALRWHVSIPEAEAAGSVDALIRLSAASRSAAVGPLLAAFLADAQHHVEHHPALRSACSCEIPAAEAARGRHDHAWVLLVDGAQTPAGRRFLSALVNARIRNRQNGQGASAGADPLIVLAACDQWQPEWTHRWCEPWRTTPLAGTSQRRVPLLSRAARAQWARDDEADPDAVAAQWYPVWLDPMTEDQVGYVTDAPGSLAPPLAASVAHRLTGGHWGAVTAVQEQREGAPPDDDATAAGRPLPAALDSGGRPLWSRALETSLPEGLAVPAARWTAPPAIVLAAAYLADARTADDPWVPAELTDLPHSLELLRRNLWVSTHAHPASRIREVGWGPADRPAALHPWLGRCVLTALSAAPALPPAGGPSRTPRDGDAEDTDPWNRVFRRQAEALAAMSAARGRPPEAAEEQRLFYELCLGRFTPVAEALAARFDRDHRAWVRLLDYLASAPCRLVHERSAPEAYAFLLAGIEERGSDVVAVATAKLLALLWLYNDPLTEHSHGWDAQIEEGFERLSHNSRLLDVSALQQAGALYA